MHRPAAAERHELRPRRLRDRRGDGRAAVHLRQRADAVPAVLAPERAQVRELHVAPGADLLDQVVAVGRGVDVVEDAPSSGVDHPQAAVVQLQAAVRADQAHVAGGEGGEALVQRLVAVHEGLVQRQRLAAPPDDPVDVAAQRVAALDRQVLVDAAGHAEAGVDAPAASRRDHLLAELADEDRPTADLGEALHHADDVAFRDGRLEAEQQVGRGQVEEVHRVGLQHLPVVHQAAHLVRRRRHPVDAGHEVHRLCGAEMVADRADAAQSLDDDRDLPVHPALDESLEAAELDDVEPGLLDLAGLVQADGDLAVALHPGDRVDDDPARAGGSLHAAHSYLRSS